jgi:hypothetical protein
VKALIYIGAAVGAWVVYRKSKGLPLMPGGDTQKPLVSASLGGLAEVNLSTVAKPPEKVPYISMAAPASGGMASSGLSSSLAAPVALAPAPTTFQKAASLLSSVISPYTRLASSPPATSADQPVATSEPASFASLTGSSGYTAPAPDGGKTLASVSAFPSAFGDKSAGLTAPTLYTYTTLVRSVF